jgi:hypothetical protein
MSAVTLSLAAHSHEHSLLDPSVDTQSLQVTYKSQGNLLLLSSFAPGIFRVMGA